jgi:hypothetical protein
MHESVPALNPPTEVLSVVGIERDTPIKPDIDDTREWAACLETGRKFSSLIGPHDRNWD